MGNRARYLVGIAVTLLGLLAGAGCRTAARADTGGVSTLPWNAPAGWENHVMGVPF